MFSTRYDFSRVSTEKFLKRLHVRHFHKAGVRFRRCDPGVTVLVMDGKIGGRKFRVCKATYANPYRIWTELTAPPNGSATLSTEIESHRPTLIPRSSELLRNSFKMHLVFLEPGCNMDDCPCSSLTKLAVTRKDNFGFAFTGEPYLSAMTLCDSVDDLIPLFHCTKLNKEATIKVSLGLKRVPCFYPPEILQRNIRSPSLCPLSWIAKFHIT